MATILGFGHANDRLEKNQRDVLEFAAGRKAVHEALMRAGASVDQLSFAEVHDCFTIAELICYEMLELTPRGQGRRAIDEVGFSATGGSRSMCPAASRPKATRSAPPGCPSM